MFTYTRLTTLQRDPESPITAELLTALDQNPDATAEGASGATITHAGWHPYDKTTVGGTETGLIYDFAVDGTLGFITTPDFADGYEYRLRFEDTKLSSGTSSLILNLWHETAGAYANAITIGPSQAAADLSSGFCEILMPRFVSKRHFVASSISNATASPISVGDVSGAVYIATAQKVLRGRIGWVSGSTAGGKIFMDKRREYVSA